MAALAVGIVVWYYRRRKTTERAAREVVEQKTVVVTHTPKDGYGHYHQAAFYKPELPDMSGRWPREPSAQGAGPQTHVQYELMVACLMVVNVT